LPPFRTRSPAHCAPARAGWPSRGRWSCAISARLLSAPGRGCYDGQKTTARAAPGRARMPEDSIDRFVEHLSESGLLSPDAVRAFRERCAAQDRTQDAWVAAEKLVDEEVLTRFQAEAVARGDSRSLLLGNYVILDMIGRGGMGEVFKAKHRMMDRIV